MSKGLEVWNAVEKYLNLYHHQAIKDDINVKTVEGMPIKIIEKELKALEIIKECFVLNGFDELIPNSKWFESEEKQKLLKEVLL